MLLTGRLFNAAGTIYRDITVDLERTAAGLPSNLITTHTMVLGATGGPQITAAVSVGPLTAVAVLPPVPDPNGPPPGVA